jgi:hypothetical protein
MTRLLAGLLLCHLLAIASPAPAQTAREPLGAITAHERVEVLTVEREVIEQKIRRHIDGWRALLTKHISEGRQLLREVLAGPLRVTPEGSTYRFEGEAAVGRLLAGTAGLTTNLVAVRGFEPRFHG